MYSFTINMDDNRNDGSDDVDLDYVLMMVVMMMVVMTMVVMMMMMIWIAC